MRAGEPALGRLGSMGNSDTSWPRTDLLSGGAKTSPWRRMPRRHDAFSRRRRTRGRVPGSWRITSSRRTTCSLTHRWPKENAFRHGIRSGRIGASATFGEGRRRTAFELRNQLSKSGEQSGNESRRAIHACWLTVTDAPRLARSACANGGTLIADRGVTLVQRGMNW